MAETKARVLVLGSTGMLGNALLRLFAASPGFEAWGSARSSASRQLLPAPLRQHVICDIDVDSSGAVNGLLAQIRPTVVINCVGVVKQLAEADDPLTAIPINSLLPHRLARSCGEFGARFVHISTDCVFAGTRGMYREEDVADARDLYGLSKYLGEVDQPHAVTLRTSLIGHELASAHGLLGWFLSQHGRVRGFSRAIFSGMPTVELGRVVRDFIIPRPELRGVQHVSAAAINKYELLRLIAAEYGKTIEIDPDGKLVIDRSLDSSRFRGQTGYEPPDWPQLIRAMREFG